MENVNKQDWFGIMIANPEISYNELTYNGITDDNVVLKSRDEYKNKKEVIDIFTDKNTGKFNEELFNSSYDNALKTYNSLANEIASDFKVPEVTNDLFDLLKTPGKKATEIKFDVLKNSNPFLKSAGIGKSIYGITDKQITNYELAQGSKIWDSNNEKWLDVTAEDKGFFGVLFSKPIVFATYDEDGEHLDVKTGRTVKHYKGQAKLDENNKPYYEILKEGQNIHGKRVLSSFDVITKEGSTLNKYDFLDNDGLDKSITGTVAQTIATIAPYFIPYVGTAYTAAMVAKNSAKLGITLTKMFDTVGDVVAGRDDFSDKSYKTLDKLEGFLGRFDVGTSEYAQNNMWSLENFGSMIADIGGQLKQQVFIASIPNKLGFGNAERKIYKSIAEKYGDDVSKKVIDGNIIKDKQLYNTLLAINPDINTAITKSLTRNSLFGRGMSLAYMSGTSTHDTYRDALEAGYDRRAATLTAAMAMGATFFVMNKYDIGTHALQGLGIDDMKMINKSATKQFLGEVKDEVGIAIDSATSDEVKSGLLRSIASRANKIWSTTFELAKKNTIAGHSVAEAIEEMSEEAIMDLSKEFTDLATWLTGTQKGGSFEFTKSNPFERYAMSAVGGAIGGGVFAGFNGSKNPDYDLPDDSKEHIFYLIRNGRAEDLISEINKQREKGIASKSLSIMEDSKIDGVTQYKPVDDINTKSQNDLVADSAIELIRLYDRLINQEGLNLKEDEIVDASLIKDSRMKSIIGYDGKFEMLADYNSIGKQMVDLLVEKESINKNATLSTGTVKLSEEDKFKIQDIDNKLNELRLEKDKIINGEYAEKYLSNSLFDLNTELSAPFFSANIYVYTRNTIGKEYSELSDPEKIEVQKAYELYKSDAKEKRNRAVNIFKNLLESKSKSIKEAVMKFATVTDISKYLSQDIDSDLFSLTKEAIDNENSKKIGANISGSTQPRIDFNYNILELDGTFDTKELGSINKIIETLPDNIMDEYQKAISESKSVAEFLEKDIVSNPDYLDGLVNSNLDLNDDTLNLEKKNSIILNDNIAKLKIKNLLEAKVAKKIIEVVKSSNEGKITQDIYNKLLDTTNTSSIKYNPELAAGEEIFIGNNEYIFEKDTNTGEYALISMDTDSIDVEINSELQSISSTKDLVDFLSKHNINLEEFDNAPIARALGIPNVNATLLNSLMLDKDNIIENPISTLMDELLVQISDDVNPVNIFKLIEQQDNKLSKVDNLQDFILSGSIEQSQLEEAKSVINIIKSLVTASSDDSVLKDYGYAPIINKIRESKGESKLLETIDGSNSFEVLRYLDGISNKVDFYLNLSKLNSNNKIKEFRLVPINAKQNIIKALLADDYFKSDLTKDVKDIVNSHPNLMDKLNSADLTDDEFIELEKMFTEIEDSIYNNAQNDGDLNANLIKSFNNSGFNYDELIDPYANANDRFGIEDKAVSTSTFFKWIHTSCAIKSSDINTILKSIVKEDLEGGEKPLIPIFGQEFAMKMNVAMIINPDVMNNMLVPFSKDGNNSDDIDKSLLIQNLIYVNGAPGVGKTNGVVVLTNRVLNKIDPEKYKDSVICGPKKEQVLNLANAILGENYTDKTDVVSINNENNSLLFDRSELKSKCITPEGNVILKEYDSIKYKNVEVDVADKDGNKVTVKKKVPRNVEELKSELSRSKYFQQSITKTTNEFVGIEFKPEVDIDSLISEESMDKKVIYIDEFTYFNRIETLLLSKYAHKHGMTILASGDVLQSGSKIHVYDDNIGLLTLSVKAPSMDTSLRISNTHKKDNLDVFRSILSYMYDDKTPNESKYTAYENNSLLKYSEDEKSLYGEKLVGIVSESEIMKLINDSNDEYVGYIYDDISSDTYKTVKKISEANPGKIKMFTVDEVQGSESKYFIIDINLKADKNNVESKVKDFYTAISRSKTGSIIVNNNSIINNIKEDNVQDYSISSDSAKTFSELKLKSLDAQDDSDLKSLDAQIIIETKSEVEDRESIESEDSNIQKITKEEAPIEKVYEKEIKEVKEVAELKTTIPNTEISDILEEVNQYNSNKSDKQSFTSGAFMTHSYSLTFKPEKNSDGTYKIINPYTDTRASILMKSTGSDLLFFAKSMNLDLNKMTKNDASKLLTKIHGIRNTILYHGIDSKLLKKLEPKLNWPKGEFMFKSIYSNDINNRDILALVFRVPTSNGKDFVDISLSKSNVTLDYKNASNEVKLVQIAIRDKFFTNRKPNTIQYFKLDNKFDIVKYTENCKLYVDEKNPVKTDFDDISFMNPGIKHSKALVLTKSMKPNGEQDPTKTPLGKGVVFVTSDPNLTYIGDNKVVSPDNYYKYYNLQLQEQKNGVKLEDRKTRDSVRMVVLSSYGLSFNDFITKYRALLSAGTKNAKQAKLLKSYSGDYFGLNILLSINEYIENNPNDTSLTQLRTLKNVLDRVAGSTMAKDSNPTTNNYFKRLSERFSKSDNLGVDLSSGKDVNGNLILFVLNRLLEGKNIDVPVYDESGKKTDTLLLDSKAMFKDIDGLINSIELSLQTKYPEGIYTFPIIDDAKSKTQGQEVYEALNVGGVFNVNTNIQNPIVQININDIKSSSYDSKLDIDNNKEVKTNETKEEKSKRLFNIEYTKVQNDLNNLISSLNKIGVIEFNDTILNYFNNDISKNPSNYINFNTESDVVNFIYDKLNELTTLINSINSRIEDSKRRIKHFESGLEVYYKGYNEEFDTLEDYKNKYSDTKINDFINSMTDKQVNLIESINNILLQNNIEALNIKEYLTDFIEDIYSDDKFISKSVNSKINEIIDEINNTAKTSPITLDDKEVDNVSLNKQTKTLDVKYKPLVLESENNSLSLILGGIMDSTDFAYKFNLNNLLNTIELNLKDKNNLQDVMNFIINPSNTTFNVVAEIMENPNLLNNIIEINKIKSQLNLC